MGAPERPGNLQTHRNRCKWYLAILRAARKGPRMNPARPLAATQESGSNSMSESKTKFANPAQTFRNSSHLWERAAEGHRCRRPAARWRATREGVLFSRDELLGGLTFPSPNYRLPITKTALMLIGNS